MARPASTTTTATKPRREPTRFPHAVPILGKQAWRRLRRRPQAPFRGANGFETSIYYWWWQYLRAQDGYRATCQNGGVGTYSALYADFGDVHAMEFWDWWKLKGAYLFAEPPIARVRELTAQEPSTASADWLAVELPTTMPLAVVVRQLRKQYGDRFAHVTSHGFNPRRSPRYVVATRFVLSTLYTHLRVWTLRIEHPDIPLHEIADKAGLVVNTRDLDPNDKVIATTVRAAKATLVSRHLRIAR